MHTTMPPFQLLNPSAQGVYLPMADETIHSMNAHLSEKPCLPPIPLEYIVKLIAAYHPHSKSQQSAR